MITHSTSLFHILTKATCTTEKGLIIDIQTVNNASQSFKVIDVTPVCSEYNIADALTKDKAHSFMKESFVNGKQDHPLQQWIICSN